MMKKTPRDSSPRTGTLGKDRIFYLEVLRCIACLAVVMIHVTGKYVETDFHSFNFHFGNMLNSVARIGVPLFIMISGALLLDEKYICTMEKIVKHIGKMIVFFIFWSVLYCFIFNIIIPITDGAALSLKDIFTALIQGHFHLWFIYMITGLYLILPLLRLWVRKINKKYIEYFLLLSVIFSFLLPELTQVISYFHPGIAAVQSALRYMNLTYVGGCTGYFVLGWYLHNYDIPYKKTVIALGITGILISAAGTFLLSIYKGFSVTLYENLSVHVMCSSVMAFMLAKKRFAQSDPKAQSHLFHKIVRVISEYSLGIYAVHVAFIALIQKLFSSMHFDFAVVVVPVTFVAAVFVSLCASVILKKLRFHVV